MKKQLLFFFAICFSVFCVVSTMLSSTSYEPAYADTQKNYYTIYKDESKKDVLFLKGDDVSAGDKYLSGDNKLYEIVSVDDKEKSAIAKFIRDEELPKYNVTKKGSNDKTANAVTKKIGIYHIKIIKILFQCWAA